MTDVALVTVDPESTDPPYVQIQRQIEAAVRRHDLVAGSRLPSVRRLATDLGLAPGTVARAYRGLEQGGVVDTRGRGGTIVTAGTDADRAEAAELAGDYVRKVRQLRISAEEALALVRAALR